jgi:alkanesulfonate monooxygenase SsuD/methylene tetrahydromethanopterin reductase-like flavin-dependent oxidoreductase (luciferase family)
VGEWGCFDGTRFGMFAFAADGTSSQGLVRRIEADGFDVAWAGDHLFHYRMPGTAFLDGWMSLAAWTQVTTTVRLGMLVSNVAWRQPVQLARFAVAVDQLSAGRLELGLGAGAFADQAMAGVLGMPAAERIDRLNEAAVVLDKLLRGDCEPFDGRYTSYRQASVAPGAVQRPRPPLVLAGNGPRALAVVARHGDVWNTWSGDATSLAELHDQVRRRVGVLRRAVDALGRDPSRLRLSLTVYHQAVDVWRDVACLEQVVARFRPLGFSDFVLYPPRLDQRGVYERVTQTRMPKLR